MRCFPSGGSRSKVCFPALFRVGLAAGILLGLSGSLGAGSFFETERESPGYCEPGTWLVKSAVLNDVFSLDHVVEWDDCRTGALEAFVRTPIPLYLELASSSFTYRASGSAAGAVGRNDTLHFVLGAIWEGDLLEGRGRALAGNGVSVSRFFRQVFPFSC